MTSERMIVTLLREIAEELGFSFRTYSYDWVKEISNGKNNVYIYGYNFPLNDACFTACAGDKACTSDILKEHGIPAVEHYYFMNPADIHYVQYLGVSGNWERMSALLRKYQKIVVKPNNGTGGAGLRIVTDNAGLENAAGEIFGSGANVAISPYYDITDEYRVIMLEGEPKVVFRKLRPSVIGNGKDNVAALTKEQIKKAGSFDKSVDFGYIPKDGEEYRLGWKHNLGQGSTPKIVTEGDDYEKVTQLAKETLDVLGGVFCSVDCVRIDGSFRVLEVNSGVMTDNLAASSDENREKAKKIYEEALLSCFEKASDK